jgi:predicted ester cyclase
VIIERMELMSVEANKAAILRFYDLMNQGKLDEAYELFAPEYVLHASTGDIACAQCKQFDASGMKALPDGRVIVHDMVAEGDKVAFRVTLAGTHTGQAFGIAPTGKKVRAHNTWIVRVREGKWVEQWGTSEMPLLMQELGVPRRATPQ